ncbi:hypothetical protein FJZ19_02965 [Candidatus Pacearchaeota archaeon]|nr:hypothetical protein [Candidatus Pacearchaeota archaeon]
MTRIIVPGREASSVYEAKEGELVLVIAGMALASEPPSAVTFGIFEKLRKEKRSVQRDNRMFPDKKREPVIIDTQVLVVNPAYTLRACLEFGGVKIPIVGKRKYTSAEFVLYRGKNCVELHFGKRNIITCLSQWDEYIPHAEWIERLKKPYSQ